MIEVLIFKFCSLKKAKEQNICIFEKKESIIYWNRPLLHPISYWILTHKWHPLLVNLIFFIQFKMMTEYMNVTN